MDAVATANMDEDILYIDKNTWAVELKRARKCMDCVKWLPVARYYERARRCKLCYDRFWMRRADKRAQEPIEMEITRAVQRANRRCRFRLSTGPELLVEEVMGLWENCKGKCCRCKTPLTFRWMPRHVPRNLAIIDRINTSENRSYSGNCQFLCADCNEEKGAWDLVEQQDRVINRLRKKLKKKKKKRAIMYESILIQG